MKNKILKTLFFVWLLCFWINQSNASLQTNILLNRNCINWLEDNSSYFTYKTNSNWKYVVWKYCMDFNTWQQYIYSFYDLDNNIWYTVDNWYDDFCASNNKYTINGIDIYNCLSFNNSNFWQIPINDFKNYFSCSESNEELIVSTDWVISCTSDNSWFWWDLFDWISNWLNSIYNSIQSFIQEFINFANSFNFDFEYTGFNFNISNFYKFLSLNITWNNKPTIYNPKQNTDCKDIFNYTTIYYNIDRGWAADCNDYTTWKYPNWSFDFVINNWNDWNNDGWLHPVNSYLWKYQLTTDNVNNDWPFCYEYYTNVNQQKFKYITNYNNNNLININTSIFDSLNIIPINLVVFNVNVTSYINSTAVYILKLTIWIFATPIEFINKLFSSFNLFNLDFKDNTNYCFAGGLWRMPSKANTPSVTISNDTNWVNGAWVELFLFLILAFNCFHTFMKLKKQFN